MKEGEEKDAFWEVLGGKAEYASDPCFADPTFEPRLFQVRIASNILLIDFLCTEKFKLRW
jgi:hypothetical protein